MTSKHLHELIDACRPGHGDIDRPEFSELARELSQDPSLQRLFEQSQRLDESVRTSFQAVAPPPGLAQRLLEAIETATIETATIEDSEATVAVAETEPRVELPRPVSRRSVGIWASVVSLAAVAALIALWFQGARPVSPTSERDIAELVDRWNAGLDEKNWQTSANIPAQDFPPWQHLKISGDDRWQAVSKRITCYDFAIENGTMRLFVVKPTASIALPKSPPAGYPSPNGWHVGAWQANGRAYYLAVRADGDSKLLYSRVISSPLA